MHSISSNSQNQEEISHTFSPVPCWIQRRKELSHGSKLLYGQLKKYSGMGRNYVYPSRETLAEDLGMSVRAVDRFISELTKNNLVSVKRTGKKLNNVYQFHPHIWSKEATTYHRRNAPSKISSESPLSAGSESPLSATPYKEISKKDNIIYDSDQKKFEDQQPEPHGEPIDLKKEFEEFWESHPRQQGKMKAFPHFCKARKEVSFETLLYKAKSFKRHSEVIIAKSKDADQETFTQMPHNWLISRGWEDHYGRNEVNPSDFAQDLKIDDNPEEDSQTKLFRDKIMKGIGQNNYRSWFMGQKMEIQGKSLVIKATTKFISDWIRDKYSTQLVSLLERQIETVIVISPAVQGQQMLAA